MTAPTIAFFNNKGGVGKMSLVYHLAWMYAELGLRVLAADLDPQANLTAAFLDEDRLEELWTGEPRTIYGAVVPLIRGIGDVSTPRLVQPEAGREELALIPGDLQLSGFEDDLAESWPTCLDGRERSFRVVSAIWRAVQQGSRTHEAQVVLMDLGPNLGALNRTALISSDHVVIPLAPDLFSLQGLRNLGPTVRRWRREWVERKNQNPARDLPLPPGELTPVGYIVLQHSVRLDRPVKAYDKWIARIPAVYREAVLDEAANGTTTVQNDPHCLALLKHYRSLMPMAQEVRKPMFHLKPADGAIGGHLDSVHAAYRDFKEIALEIAQRTGLPVPAPA